MSRVVDFFPLTAMQAGMFFHTLFDPSSGVYFEQFVYRLDGDVDRSAYEAAWQRVVDRHEVLRAAVLWEGLDEPIHVIHEGVSPEWTYPDWRALPPDEQAAALERFLAADRDRGFDFATPPLIRMALARTGDESYQLVLSYHHLILDAWSLFVMLRESLAYYAAVTGGNAAEPGEPRRFRGYVEALRRADGTTAREYWATVLDGFKERTLLGRSVPHNAASDAAKHHEERLDLAPGTTEALAAFCRRNHLTLNTVVQGAWALLLHAYTDRRDVAFGITISYRPVDLVGVEDMVGICINSLPTRVDVDRDRLLVPWLRQLQRAQAESRIHEHCPLSEIHAVSPMGSTVPLFDTLLIFENFPKGTDWDLTGGVSVRQQRYVGWTNYPLAIEAMPGEHLYFQVKYDQAYFDASDVRRLLDDFGAILTAIPAVSGAVGALPLPAPSSGGAPLDRPAHDDAAAWAGDRSSAPGDDSPTPEQARLAAVWADVLGVDEVGVHDDFFELGGDSLRSIQILGRAREAGFRFQLKDVFTCRTIARLTAAL